MLDDLSMNNPFQTSMDILNGFDNDNLTDDNDAFGFDNFDDIDLNQTVFLSQSQSNSSSQEFLCGAQLGSPIAPPVTTPFALNEKDLIISQKHIDSLELKIPLKDICGTDKSASGTVKIGNIVLHELNPKKLHRIPTNLMRLQLGEPTPYHTRQRFAAINARLKKHNHGSLSPTIRKKERTQAWRVNQNKSQPPERVPIQSLPENDVVADLCKPPNDVPKTMPQTLDIELESASFEYILNELFSSTKKELKTCKCAERNCQCDSNVCPCFAKNQCCHLGCNCLRCLNLLPKDEMKKLDEQTDFEIKTNKLQRAKKQTKKRTQRITCTTHLKRRIKRAKKIKTFSNTGTQTDKSILIKTT